jgi:hypothetical protein
VQDFPLSFSAFICFVSILCMHSTYVLFSAYWHFSYISFLILYVLHYSAYRISLSCS